MSKMRYLALAVLFAFGLQVAMADVANKKTKLTFSGPVQVPGATLPAGTYVFKLMDSSADRHIVQVTNVRGDKTYATILAIPDYRINATSKTVMYFGERKSGTPPAVKSWFYPGDNYGDRFVYPKVEATKIAAEVKQPVPVHEAPKIEAKVAQAPPVKTVTPAAAEQKYEVVIFEKVDVVDTAGTDGEAVQEAAPAAPAQQLPKTSSPLHLAMGLGGLLLSASALARYAKSRLS
jgi:hypothetical protein